MKGFEPQDLRAISKLPGRTGCMLKEILNLFALCVCLSVCLCVCAHVPQHMWFKGNLKKLDFSFYRIGFRNNSGHQA